MKTYFPIYLLAAMFLFTGCDKMLEFEPGDVILAEDALNTPEDLQLLLNSNYDVIGNLYDGRVQNLAELLTDNLALPETNLDYQAVHNRQTNFFTSTPGGVYTDFFRAVYRSNVVLESFDLIDGLSDDERIRIEAEARFIRAIAHFQVVRLWAQPYGYTPNNTHLGIPIRDAANQDPLPRSTVQEVYDFIEQDLIFAYNNLPDNNDVYATRYSAAGFLSYMYFLQGEFQNSVNYANEAMSGPFELDPTLNRFKQDQQNSETVFGIVGNLNDIRSEAFRDNYRSDNNPSPTLTFSESFANLLGQNPSDDRNEWLTVSGTTYLVNRFNNMEYFNVPVIYLTQLKLIRAEALAELGTDLPTAIDDVNDIRERAFGPGVNTLPETATAEDIIDAARIEYRKESVCEGTYIDQLKRRGTMGEDIQVRGAPWDCPGMALQFPNGETSAAGFILNPEGGCN